MTFFVTIVILREQHHVYGDQPHCQVCRPASSAPAFAVVMVLTSQPHLSASRKDNSASLPTPVVPARAPFFFGVTDPPITATTAATSCFF